MTTNQTRHRAAIEALVERLADLDSAARAKHQLLSEAHEEVQRRGQELDLLNAQRSAIADTLKFLRAWEAA